jgi:phosphohistidine phosphatase
MKVYLLRHAEAEPGADDAARRLTSDGHDQARLVGRFLRRAGIELDAVFSSPLVRARQTAQIVLESGPRGKDIRVQFTDLLLNEATEGEFQRWLGRWAVRRGVLLVGHAPSLPAHARALLGFQAPEALHLPKAGLLCVDTQTGRRGALKFLVTPKLLRAM